MKRLISGALGLLALCILAAPSAWAGSNPWGDWQGNWQFQDPGTAQVNLNAATEQYLFKHPALMGTQSTTTFSGPINETFNGPVNNSGATNAVNVNSTTVNAVDGSKVTVTSGQSSGVADQTANSTIKNK